MVGLVYTPRSLRRNQSRFSGLLGIKTYFGAAALSLWTITALVRVQPAAAGNVTLFGRILNLPCYTAHESNSRVYRKCVRLSRDIRSPSGLLASDGTVYLLMEDPVKSAQRTRLLERGRVRVKGKLIRRGGLPLLAVTALHKA